MQFNCLNSAATSEKAQNRREETALLNCKLPFNFIVYTFDHLFTTAQTMKKITSIYSHLVLFLSERSSCVLN